MSLNGKGIDLQDTSTANTTRYVSTNQVAKAIGMSVTTVKRWVDEGILPAHRTAGGHRKLLLGDVIRLVRDGNLPQVDLTALLKERIQPTQENTQRYLGLFKNAAVEQDMDSLHSLIIAAYQSGISVATLADDLIAPTMRFVGHQWVSGDMRVLDEHRVTQTVVTALYELTSLIRQNAESNRPVAVGGAPEHDYYLLPTLLAKLVLLECGWDAINIGPHTPFSTFENSFTQLKPQLIWICVSFIQNTELFLKEYRHFYRQAEELGIPVAVGGFGLTENLREQMPYSTYGDRLSQLAAFAKTIHNRPPQPTRGRPVGSGSKPDIELKNQE